MLNIGLRIQRLSLSEPHVTLGNSRAGSPLERDWLPFSEGLFLWHLLEVHAPILSLWGVKIVVISLFLGCALASIALCTRIEPGLEQKIVLPRDSYLQGYFNNVSEYLRIGPPLYFVVKNYNYRERKIRF
ncbi:uncharacterized protein LOC142631702 isoform X4 [Castanea sativa]|uniref:uncharacterized protein LOC142631702 isoform X4 n=1 Tax=Castanea sativa TaxID=21020 RepID=UPI003F65083C